MMGFVLNRLNGIVQVAILFLKKEIFLLDENGSLQPGSLCMINEQKLVEV